MLSRNGCVEARVRSVGSLILNKYCIAWQKACDSDVKLNCVLKITNTVVIAVLAIGVAQRGTFKIHFEQQKDYHSCFLLPKP